MAIATAPHIHNGTFTILSLKSGESRTFRVSSGKDPARPARFLSLLTGPDNTADYTGIAILTEDGIVRPFKKHAGTAFEKLAVSFGRVMNPNDPMSRLARVEESRECRRCGRKLTTISSVDAGIGPECALKE